MKVRTLRLHPPARPRPRPRPGLSFWSPVRPHLAAASSAAGTGVPRRLPLSGWPRPADASGRVSRWCVALCAWRHSVRGALVVPCPWQVPGRARNQDRDLRPQRTHGLERPQATRIDSDTVTPGDQATVVCAAQVGFKVCCFVLGPVASNAGRSEAPWLSAGPGRRGPWSLNRGSEQLSPPHGAACRRARAGNRIHAY
jgi:hypothetical protein